MLKMPIGCDDITQKHLERLIVADQTLVEEPGVPIKQDPPDIENDGGRPTHPQPWRALKRRLVLLIT